MMEEKQRQALVPPAWGIGGSMLFSERCKNERLSGPQQKALGRCTSVGKASVRQLTTQTGVSEGTVANVIAQLRAGINAKRDL